MLNNQCSFLLLGVFASRRCDLSELFQPRPPCLLHLGSERDRGGLDVCSIDGASLGRAPQGGCRIPPRISPILTTAAATTGWAPRTPRLSQRAGNCRSPWPSRVPNRARNDPKPGLASPNHITNLSGPVLGCIDASNRESRPVFQDFSRPKSFALVPTAPI